MLRSNEMRGVRMLLEITKPELILEEQNIISTIIVFGGAKINDELFELLTLHQTGMKSKIPIILFGKRYWENLINFEFLADYGLISKDDLNIFKYADSASEAWEIIDSNKLSKNKL